MALHIILNRSVYIIVGYPHYLAFYLPSPWIYWTLAAATSQSWPPSLLQRATGSLDTHQEKYTQKNKEKDHQLSRHHSLCTGYPLQKNIPPPSSLHSAVLYSFCKINKKNIDNVVISHIPHRHRWVCQRDPPVWGQSGLLQQTRRLRMSVSTRL